MRVLKYTCKIAKGNNSKSRASSNYDKLSVENEETENKDMSSVMKCTTLNIRSDLTIFKKDKAICSSVYGMSIFFMQYLYFCSINIMYNEYISIP